MKTKEEYEIKLPVYKAKKILDALKDFPHNYQGAPVIIEELLTNPKHKNKNICFTVDARAGFIDFEDLEDYDIFEAEDLNPKSSSKKIQEFINMFKFDIYFPGKFYYAMSSAEDNKTVNFYIVQDSPDNIKAILTDESGLAKLIKTNTAHASIITLFKQKDALINKSKNIKLTGINEN